MEIHRVTVSQHLQIFQVLILMSQFRDFLHTDLIIQAFLDILVIDLFRLNYLAIIFNIPKRLIINVLDLQDCRIMDSQLDDKY